MTWLIIFLILAVAIGPVLYLLPNARDKRLTALREQARRLSFTVQITSLPRLDPHAQERVSAGGKVLSPRRPCTAYKIPIGQSLHGVGSLLLLKLPDSPSVIVNEVMPGWGLDGDSSERFWRSYSAVDGTVEQLLDTFAKLPVDALGVSLDDRFVACYWLEKAAADSGAISELYDVLSSLRSDLCRRFGATPA